MNPLSDVDVECPYFSYHDKLNITCESYIPRAMNRVVFKRVADKKKYFDKVCCCDYGKQCYHYRLMSNLYERGLLK